MSDSDIERRLLAVEDELRVLREEAAAARALAAGADRDVAEYRGELRSHTRMLNALRETQAEQGATLARMDESHAALNRGVTAILGLLTAMSERDNGGAE